MPDETVIDGEIVALDESGKPSFSALQNYGAGGAQLVYYVFDVMIIDGRDVTNEPLTVRRALLHSRADLAGRANPRVVGTRRQPAAADPVGEGARS